jgi:hypothetical protein
MKSLRFYGEQGSLPLKKEGALTKLRPAAGKTLGIEWNSKLNVMHCEFCIATVVTLKL